MICDKCGARCTPRKGTILESKSRMKIYFINTLKEKKIPANKFLTVIHGFVNKDSMAKIKKRTKLSMLLILINCFIYYL
jgi:hypothetical protein